MTQLQLKKNMLDQAKNVFIIGIKGVAMANLALILKKMGKKVTGSDVEEEFITAPLLKENNIQFITSFKPEDLAKETDLVIYSAAHAGVNNPQTIEAKKRGIKVISQAEVLGELTSRFKTTIAVCGSHGKTTTASLLAYSLIKLCKKPSYLVGAPSFNGYWGGDYQNTDYFVVEADEYGVNPPRDLQPKFHFLRPDYVICTNIDFDHPDMYKNLGETKKSFLTFFQKTYLSATAAQNRLIKKLIFCADDENLMDVARNLPREKYITFGYNKYSDFQIKKFETNEKESFFTLKIKSKGWKQINPSGWKQKLFRISLFGEKNMSNAAGVVAFLLSRGFSADDINRIVADFTGARRRFEKKVSINNILLFDDYAHHPAEIRATISTARERFPGKRIVIIFQPHTYSRTQALLPDFAKSLAKADKSFILPIFASAREKSSDFHTTSKDIVKLNPNKLTSVSSKSELLQLLASFLQPQDVIFTMGAGDVYRLKDDIIQIIKHET